MSATMEGSNVLLRQVLVKSLSCGHALTTSMESDPDDDGDDDKILPPTPQPSANTNLHPKTPSSSYCVASNNLSSSNFTLSPLKSKTPTTPSLRRSSAISDTTWTPLQIHFPTSTPFTSSPSPSSLFSHQRRKVCPKNSPILSLANLELEKIDEREMLQIQTLSISHDSPITQNNFNIPSTMLTLATPPLSEISSETHSTPGFQLRHAFGLDSERCSSRLSSLSSSIGSDIVIHDGISSPFCMFSKFRRSDITFGRLLGKGGFGTVYAAHIAGHNVAVKIVQKRRGSGIHREIIQAERLAFRLNLRHENIVAILGVNMCEELRGDALILMELVTSDSLQSLIDDVTRAIDIEERLDYALQVSRALHYLHRNSVAHMDVKPANVLMTSDHVCKLSDFGSLILTGPHVLKEEPEFTQLLGTLPYRAPELMTGDFPSAKADIYSFGITLWQMLTREKPHQTANPHALIYQVVKFNIRPTQPDTGNDITEIKYNKLYTSCWSREAAERPDADQIIKTLVDMIQCFDR